MMDFTSYLLNDTESTEDEILEQVNQELAEREAVPSLIEEMQVKIAQAYNAGIKLAREHGAAPLDNALEKTALLPLLTAGLGMAGRAVAGQAAKGGVKSMIGGAAKNMAKDTVINGGMNAVSGAARSLNQRPAGGGFKYAGVGDVLGRLGGQARNLASSLGGKGPGTLGQKIVGGMVRNPGAALVGAGAIGGAIMAPRDPVTGERQMLRGAATGAALGGGAYALGGGNKLRHAIVSPKGPQIFGSGAGGYTRAATKATGPSALRSSAAATASSIPSPAAAPQGLFPHDPMWSGLDSTIKPRHEPLGGGASGVHVDPALLQEAAAHNARMNVIGRSAESQTRAGGGGMVNGRRLGGGQVVGGEMTSKFASMLAKLANRQTLQYDPATKTMIRRHETPSSIEGSPELTFQPGHREEVLRRQMGGPAAAPTAAGAPQGMGQTHALHGGDVLSSSPAAGMGARPLGVPPKPPAAALARRSMPSLAGATSVAQSPIAAGAGAALRAAPKPPALPSLAGMRALKR